MGNWIFRIWDDEMNLELFKKEFPDLVVKYSKLSKGVMKADIARLAYLHTFGGWYIDTDYLLLRPLWEFKSPENMAIIPQNRFRNCGTKSLGNAILGSPKGHPIWSKLIRGILEPDLLQIEKDHDVVEKTGPKAITRISNNDALSHSFITPSRLYFHPSKRIPIPRKSFGVHLCFGTWRVENN
jgi:mannosyltransferase OCH1-like enzyme